LIPAPTGFMNGYQNFRAGVEPILDGLWAAYSADQKAQLSTRGYNAPGDVVAMLDQSFGWGSGSRSVTSAAPDLPGWASEPVSQSSIKAILDSRTFELFASTKSGSHHTPADGGTLESQPHDNVHGGTGGFMGAFLSPVDPIFWLHHANLDRLWYVWSERQKKVNLPHTPEGGDLTAWNGEAFLFFHDKDGAPLAKKSGDYIDTGVLGYGYEPGSGEELVVAAQSLSMPVIQTFSATAINSELRTGFESSVAVTGLAIPLQSAAKDEGPELYARISLTPPDELIGTRLRVYINCPYLSKYTPVEDPHFAGSVTFFSALHQGGHQHGDFVTTIPLGRALRALDQQNKLPVSAIKVQLITDTLGGSEVTDGLLKQVVIEAA
jgi:tyrosinase